VAIDDLLSALQREAEAEIRAIGTEAHGEAERIATAAACRCAELTRAAADEHRAAAEARADAEIAAATREAARRVLSARAAMLERLHEAVAAELPGLVDEAMRARLRAAARAIVGEAQAVEQAAATGLRLEVDGGRLAIDATLESLLERLWPRLRIEAVREVLR
jgi:vacuolar-type H+-ATPase subunit E/Vma4